MFFCRCYMWDCGNSTSSTFCMTMFQKMRNLIPVLGVNCHCKRITGLLRFLGSPTLFISTGSLWSICRYFFFNFLTNILHTLLYHIAPCIGIFRKALHNNICELINTYCIFAIPSPLYQARAELQCLVFVLHVINK